MSTAAVKTKKVGDIVYAFTTMPASKALRMHAAIARVVADALASAGAAKALAALGGKETDEADKEAVIVALLNAIGSLPPDDWQTPDGRKMMGIETLMRLMFEHVTVGGAALDIDTNFTGRTRDMYQVLIEALRFNLADFFTGSVAAIASSHAAAKAV